MNEFFVWFFSSEHLLIFMGKCCFGIFIFLTIDIILQLGLLGSKLKQKWINFLNSEDSIYRIAIIGFFIYILITILEPDIAYAASDEELTKATLEASNVKISNIDQAIRYGTEAGIFTGLSATTGKLAKSSSLPLGSKLTVSIGGGVLGLLVFKGIQYKSSYTRPQSRITVQADSVKSNVSISSSEAEKLIVTKDKSFPAKSMLDPNDNIEDKDFYIIAKEGVEVLIIDYYIHLVII